MNREELAWAAGFFDGEGTIGMARWKSKNGKPYSHPHLRIEQNDRYVLDRFQNIVGIGKVNGPYKRAKHPNSYWTYDVQSLGGVHKVFELLYEFLSPIKRLQGNKVLDECEQLHKRDSK